MADDGGTSAEGISRLDRLLSRFIALVGLLGLVAWVLIAHHPVPPQALLGFVGAYALGKIIVAVAGLARGWRPWPAAFAEAAAIVLVAWIVLTGHREPLYLFGCVLLLLASMYWRRRVARESAVDA